MSAHLETGRLGELAAAKYLEEKGYEIVERNWCFGKREIDLIVRYDAHLIFVEVKTRTGAAYGFPELAITNDKAAHVLFAAENYIFIKDIHADIRFDVVSVLFGHDGKTELLHLKDAFY